MGDGRLGEEEAGVNVHTHHLPVRAFLDVRKVLGTCDARDVPEHVEAAELLDGGRDGRDALVTTADVAGARLERGPGIGDELGGLRERVPVEVVREHLRTLAGQPQCDRPSDARACARDQRDLSFEACLTTHVPFPSDAASVVDSQRP